jgi:hypothetical protein
VRRPTSFTAFFISFLTTSFGVLLCTLSGCSSQTASDAGADATADATAELCDLDAFKASGGDGHVCPQVSARLCFPVCSGGCKCTSTSNGPRWKCTTDLSCFDGGDDGAVGDSGSVSDTGADSATDAAFE